MEEESFSVLEKDWYKDKDEVNSRLVGGMLEKLTDLIAFKKNSTNIVYVKVVYINEKGGFNCDVSILDSLNNVLADAKGIACLKGGTWGTKLNLIKDGAEKEGKLLGKALRKNFKKR